jgi:hypothetical protein
LSVNLFNQKKFKKMSNISNNRISVELSIDAINNVKAALVTISENLPFLIGLTVEERRFLPKISEVNKVFTEDAVVALQNNPTLLPGYFDVKEVVKDLRVYQQLDEIVLLTAQLAEKLSDTQMLAGSEAYTLALTAYRLFEAASKAGVPGTDAIYDQLKQRFAGQGNFGTTQAPDTPAV